LMRPQRSPKPTDMKTFRPIIRNAVVCPAAPLAVPITAAASSEVAKASLKLFSS